MPLMKVRFDCSDFVVLRGVGGQSSHYLHRRQGAPLRAAAGRMRFHRPIPNNTKDIGEASRIVNSLLQLMEDYDAPGLLVATTNIESSLDSALFRRFDDVFLVPLPGPEEIEKLLSMTLSAVVVEPIDWERLVKELSGASAAMVVKAAQDAAKAAVLDGRKESLKSDLQHPSRSSEDQWEPSREGITMPGEHNFEHLPLLVRHQGRAPLRAAVSHPHRRWRTGMRDKRIASSADRSAIAHDNWQKRKAQAGSRNSLSFPRASRFSLQVDPSLEFDVLREKFTFEIVAEQEEGYVIVASEDIELAPFLAMVNGFAVQVHGSATIAPYTDSLTTRSSRPASPHPVRSSFR